MMHGADPLRPVTPADEEGTDPEVGYRRAPRPIEGWALLRASRLDRAGARGLLADMATMPDLTLQAAFCVLGTIDWCEPQPFMDRLSIQVTGPEGVGETLRTCRARDLVAAAFGIASEQLPTGYLRALLRVEGELYSGKGKPLAKPSSYRRLYEIINGPDEAKKHALRYCGPITSGVIEAVDRADPAVLLPELMRYMRTPSGLERVNAAVALMREVSSAPDETLRAAIVAGLSAGRGVDSVLKRWLEEHADFFPPPLAPQAGITPVTSGRAMCEVGREFGNCLRSKIGEAVLGMAAYYVVEHRPEGGLSTNRYVVELTPVSTGGWVISTIEAKRGERLSRGARQAVAKRMTALGALLPINPIGHPDTERLATLLGLYDPVHGYGHGLEALEDAPDGEVEAAREEVA